MKVNKDKPYIACEPLVHGGVAIHGNTPHATFFIEIDGNADLLKYDFTIKTTKAKKCFGCKTGKSLITKKEYGPGDFVAKAVEIATVGKVKMCPACKSRRSILNKMGWKGVLKNPLKAIKIFFNKNPIQQDKDNEENSVSV